MTVIFKDHADLYASRAAFKQAASRSSGTSFSKIRIQVLQEDTGRTLLLAHDTDNLPPDTGTWQADESEE